MGAYIPYTEEQLALAASVNIERFLDLRGEELKRSGKEKRLTSDKSITVDGNEWYDHGCEIGGNAISFVQNFYGCTFQESVNMLLDSQNIRIPDGDGKKDKEDKPRKPFALPPANEDMRRTYRYLMEKRLIPKDILDYFVKVGKLYESKEPDKKGDWFYHNAIFVGYDIDGKPRHAHKHGISMSRKNFKGNIPSVDPNYGFFHVGTSDRLYVFEAPIDMLSFIALYPHSWQEHSYLCLCGTAKHALVRALEEYSHLEKVVLCLDHDEAGIESAGRLTEELQENGYNLVATLLPYKKDWNEVLKAKHGLEALPPEQHPQIVMFDSNMAAFCEMLSKDAANKPLDGLIAETRRLQSLLQKNDYGEAGSLGWELSGLWVKEFLRHQPVGGTLSPEEVCESLRCSFAPHRNRRNSKNLARDISGLASCYYMDAKGAAATSHEVLAEKSLDICLKLQMLVVRARLDEQKMLERLQKLTGNNCLVL